VPTVETVLELGSRRVFASALDWPGWARSGRDEAAALEALAAYAPRYRRALARTGPPRPRLGAGTVTPVVVERLAGSTGTDVGAPMAPASAEGRPLSAAQARRRAAVVAAAWAELDAAAAAAPAVLVKGPRGGGRDRDPIVAHVVEAERSYGRKIGVRIPPFDPADPAARGALRDALLEVLSRPSDGGLLAEKGWTARYAARRIAWHALDHAWELQDKTPGTDLTPGA
jgi:hypothetical protein